MLLEGLSEASLPEWSDQLFIDSQILNGLALWLVSRQDPSTGAFKRSAQEIYDVRMRVSDVICEGEGLKYDVNGGRMFSRTCEGRTVKS